MKVILASASPRRKELLSKLDMEFDIVPASGDEKITDEDAFIVVQKLAGQKAAEIYERYDEDVLVIGADTVVSKEGHILGKPKDTEDAVRMLKTLQGSVHQVYTGVCLLWRKSGKEYGKIFFECTDVEFYPMSEDEIRSYVDTGEPMDKAGSYGIQGSFAVYVRGIIGDYNNVIGLPLSRLYHEIVKIIA